jgi:3,8-divinyl chlorophyllide a/chlorophyllide a reductase subunit Z
VVANETYTRGLANFFDEDLGMPATLVRARRPGEKTDHDEIRKTLHEKPPLLLFGSFNERMYAAEAGLRCQYIPASFPGALVRRHPGTPFMGYSGAVYLTQEICNALFDALFHILPLGSRLDSGEATLARPTGETLPWEDEAREALDRILQTFAPLVRISVAKRIRDAAEAAAREAGEERVGMDRLQAARRGLGEAA